MGYLDSYTYRRAFLDVGTDADTTEVIDLNGYEVVAIGLPATLDDALNDITFDIDPGDGTFRLLNDSAGAPVSIDNLVAGEMIQVPSSNVPIVGARLRLQLSATEAADREFLVLLRALAPNVE